MSRLLLAENGWVLIRHYDSFDGHLTEEVSFEGGLSLVTTGAESAEFPRVLDALALNRVSMALQPPPPVSQSTPPPKRTWGLTAGDAVAFGCSFGAGLVCAQLLVG